MNKLTNVWHYLWGGLLHFAHRMFIPLMLFVITYAVFIVGFNSLTPWARLYKPEINSFLVKTLHQQIEVEDVKTSWYGIYPVIKLINVKFADNQGQTWNCHELWFGLDLLRSLFYWHIHPGLLYIDGLDLNIVQTQGRWDLLQAKFLQNDLVNKQEDISANAMKIILGALGYLPEKILFKNIHLFVAPEHARTIDFKELYLLGQKKQGRYFWSAEANFGEKSILSARADMPLLSNLQIPDKGRLYLEAKDLKLRALPWYKELKQYLTVKDLQGELTAQAWIDWQNHAIATMHINFLGEDLNFSTQVKGQTLKFKELSANLLWQKNLEGWEVAVDHLNLREQNLIDDKFLLYYQGDWDNYHFYIQDLPLALLKTCKPFLPNYIWQYPLSELRGDLKNLQLNFKEGNLDYFLTQFEALSLPLTAKHPGISGLSGVFNWEPQNLRVELASDNLIVNLKALPPLNFQSLHAVFGTNQVLDKTRLQIERFVLSRPDLALTFSGEVDDPFDSEKRNLRVLMNWSLEKGEQWRPYLSALMPSSDLRNWLQKDIKRISKSSGDMVINGFSKDFPFDHHEGEFSVNAYLYGVDLFFSTHWPMVKQIDGHLTVHQRNLEVGIDKAFLMDTLPVKQLSLVAPDLGLNREVLLIHGQLTAPIKEIYAYLLNTPLASKVKTWQSFDAEGPADLDLKLDIPLYKGRDNVLTMGHLDFPEQKMNLNIFSKPLPVTNFNGFLDFDAEGLSNGSLNGNIGVDKFSMELDHQGVLNRTLFNFNGALELSILKQALNIGTADFIQGHLPFEGQIILPHGQDVPVNMNWKSGLQGVRLDLPGPWNKTAQDIKPFILNIILQGSGLKMHADYENSQWDILKQGQIWKVASEQTHIGGQISYDVANGNINANLTKLWLDGSLLSDSSDKLPPPWKVKDLPNIHIEAQDFRWEDMNLGELKFDGKKAHKKWVLNELSVSSPFYGFLMHGDVTYDKRSKYKTQINAEMKINQLARALESWQITPVANSKDGYLTFQGQWAASLNQIRLKTLVGGLDVMLKKGNITHLDPDTEKKIGLGKLLSILSLQTLPRRLQLDFSDLATNGFTFDVFKGHFDLNDGLLKTTDSQMDGPIANIKIQGDLNVVNRWYDLELQVYPYITASLPVVATIAGGPLAGIATWAANHVINQGMQKVSGYTYKITGPWQQPIVQQVSLQRKRS
jgi:hypothetical protein